MKKIAFTPEPFDSSGFLTGLRTREWRTIVQIRGLRLHIRVARIAVDYLNGRVRTRGWYAKISGYRGKLSRVMAYYERIDDVFGSDGLGTRGYGRTREDAVRFLRTALLRGWMASGKEYAPVQYDFSYKSEYDL